MDSKKTLVGTSVKVERPPSTLLLPNPLALITTVDGENQPNIITVAWIGIVCSQPPMISISVRPGRHSYPALRDSKEFVVNLPDKDHLIDADYCGIVSGKDVDKFAATAFSPVAASKVAPPLIAECPINLECQVRHQLSLGVHDIFIAEVVATHVNQEILKENGQLDLVKADLAAYNGTGGYIGLGEDLGSYGFSKKVKQG